MPRRRLGGGGFVFGGAREILSNTRRSRLSDIDQEHTVKPLRRRKVWGIGFAGYPIKPSATLPLASVQRMHSRGP